MYSTQELYSKFYSIIPCLCGVSFPSLANQSLPQSNDLNRSKSWSWIQNCPLKNWVFNVPCGTLNCHTTPSACYGCGKYFRAHYVTWRIQQNVKASKSANSFRQCQIIQTSTFRQRSISSAVPCAALALRRRKLRDPILICYCPARPTLRHRRMWKRASRVAPRCRCCCPAVPGDERESCMVREPELKGSIGEGPNQTNYSDRSSVKILAKFRNFR